MDVLRYTINRLIAVKTYRFEKSISVILNGILYSFGFAIFTALMAKIRFYTPFTPVPFTGQVFAVLLSGLILGKVFGPLSQILYIGIGLSGINWFAIGPFSLTGGYIVGFFVASFLIGLITEDTENQNIFITALSMVAGLTVIYTMGLIQFCIYTGNQLSNGLKLAVLPFIPFDLLKAFIAVVIGRLVLKKVRNRVKAIIT